MNDAEKKVLVGVRRAVTDVTNEIDRSGWPQVDGENAIARAHEEIQTLASSGAFKGRQCRHLESLSTYLGELAKVIRKGIDRSDRRESLDYDLRLYLDRIEAKLDLCEITRPSAPAPIPAT